MVACDITELGKRVFAGLARSDQRHWARLYLNGLLLGGGRKTLRRMCAELCGKKCEQSLQQFISQSPWDHTEVLRALAECLCAELTADAWTVHQVAFAKNGNASAGVERQYVPALGRVINCQMGLSVALTVGDIAMPVYWRLMLPSTWADGERRQRCRIPDQERPLPVWRYTMEALDEIIGVWGLPVPPIVLESQRVGEADRLVTELNDRRVDYAVAIHPTQPLRLAARRTPNGQQTVLPPPLPAEECHRAADARRTVAWTDQEQRLMRSHLWSVPVRLATTGGTWCRSGPTVNLVVEAPLGRPDSCTFWLTNLVNRPLDGLIQLLKSHPRASRFFGAPLREVGLYDFEGRNYRGWHHHVSVASVAFAHVAVTRRRRLLAI